MNKNWSAINRNRSFGLGLCMILLLGLLAACGGNDGSNDEGAASSNAPANSAEPTTDAKPELAKETLVLNWFAEPEHAGAFAAKEKGFYEEGGLDITLMPGGPSVSSTQIVASGQAKFGMANADDILIARQEGIPVVAIATAFQKSPQALFYHKEAGIDDFGDLNGHKVYVAATASYWLFIKEKYGLTDVQEMMYTGSMVDFLNDSNVVTQGYVTSEAYNLEQEGVDFGYLLNADSGYNIYAGVYFTTEKTLEEHPEQVKAFVEATVKGWDYYKDNWEEINPAIHEMNPEMSLDQMAFSVGMQEEFAYGGDAATMGTGVMTEARWSELQDQLYEVGVLKEKEDIHNVFTTEFLPTAP